MDKVKKFLFLPLVYHVILLAVLAGVNIGGLTATMNVLIIELLVGAVVTPVLLALISMIHAIFHEAKVYDYIYNCLLQLLIIGVIRFVLYTVFKGGVTGMTVALACFLVSVGIFTMWACLFALLNRFMKKSPSRKNKKK